MQWTIIGGVAAIAAGACALQWNRASVLDRELAGLREEQREIAALRAEVARLQAAQASADELAALAAQQAEMNRTRERVAALNQRLRVPLAGSAEVEMKEMPPSAWRYVGRATPREALETALWAAAGGEIDVLADGLVLDPPARARAETLFGGLSPAARAEHRTAERLVALMAAKDVPQGSATVVRETERGEDEVVLRIRMRETGGEARTANLTLRRMPEGWRFVVPESAVQRYADILKGDRGA